MEDKVLYLIIKIFDGVDQEKIDILIWGNEEMKELLGNFDEA